jgi:hypothetical protein
VLTAGLGPSTTFPLRVVRQLQTKPQCGCVANKRLGECIESKGVAAGFDGEVQHAFRVRRIQQDPEIWFMGMKVGRGVVHLTRKIVEVAFAHAEVSGAAFHSIGCERNQR